MRRRNLLPVEGTDTWSSQFVSSLLQTLLKPAPGNTQLVATLTHPVRLVLHVRFLRTFYLCKNTLPWSNIWDILNITELTQEWQLAIKQIHSWQARHEEEGMKKEFTLGPAVNMWSQDLDPFWLKVHDSKPLPYTISVIHELKYAFSITDSQSHNS